MIELGYTSNPSETVIAGQGAAATTGGSLAGAGATNAAVTTAASESASESTDIISATSADATTPESAQQYMLRDLISRLPPKQPYMVPCIWGDAEYWMDS